MNCQNRFEPLGVRGVHHSSTSQISLEDSDQGQDSLHRQPPDCVVNESEVGPVEDRVQDPGVIAVEALDQELGHRVCPRGTGAGGRG